MESQTSPKLRVLMLPWLAYGHISPFLELAKKLSDKDIQTHLCSTRVNLDSIKDKLPEKFSTSVHLVEFYLPVQPDLPPHHHTTNGLPLHLIATLKQTLDSSEPEVSRILAAVQPDIVIHDLMLQWVSKVAAADGIPAVPFLTGGAAMCSAFCHSLMKPAGEEYPFPEMRLTGVELDMFNTFVESTKRKRGSLELPSPPLMALIKSSRVIEGKYMDYLSEIMRWKLVPAGALVCRDLGPDIDPTSQDLMNWLEKKDAHSTVYVSFGSEYYLKGQDFEEIAHGLELSGANFIWVIRFPAGVETRVEEVLPKGFLERVGERGRVVEKWAPQGRILGCQSVGGFVSHCGWGSLMESVDFGVPLIAMPMHLDQPLNGRLVVALGVGVDMGRDEKGRFERGEIGRVIKSVLDAKNGPLLRSKVGEVREALRANSAHEMDRLVQEIVGLCGKDT